MRLQPIACLALVAACTPPPSETPKAPAHVEGSPRSSNKGKPKPSPAPRREGDLLRPCKRATPEAAVAKATLDDLDAKIEKLPLDGDPGPLAEAVRALANTPCFALAFDDADETLAWSTALSLRTWWRDGGSDWLATYLGLGDPDRRFRVPPSPRRAMTLESEPADAPLRLLLCPSRAVDDGSCGRETAGWALRADHAFATGSQQGLPREGFCLHRLEAESHGSSPWTVYRGCISNHTTRRSALPLGAFRAPESGWFVLARVSMMMRAGCSEDLALFDLATGAAYYHRCPPYGSAQVEVGRVSLSALREAAWMTFLVDELDEEVRVFGELFYVDEKIPIEKPRGEKAPGGVVRISGSDEPMRLWSWILPRAPGGPLVTRASGLYELSGAGAWHASLLLDVLDAGFQAGCAPATPPRPLPAPTEGRAAELFGRYRDAVTTITAARAQTAPRAPCPPLP
jgi:hypothetical protein